MLGQEHPQPARTEVHCRLLLQIGRQARGGPDIEGQPQGARQGLQRRLQRCHIGRIGSHWAPGARGIDQRGYPTRRKPVEPVGHRLDRAPAPAGDPLHVIAQGRRFDHLQPLAHPPRQIGAPQLLLDLGALPHAEGQVSGSHALAPFVLLPRAPAPAPQPTAAYPLSAEFTSGYLAWIIHGAT
jgi:hypothetical protein